MSDSPVSNQENRALTRKWVETQRAIERVGPPSLRNEPWRGPPSPVAAEPDAACELWLAEQDREGYRMSKMERGCARAAFLAGWEAHRKLLTTPQNGAWL